MLIVVLGGGEGEREGQDVEEQYLSKRTEERKEKGSLRID